MNAKHTRALTCRPAPILHALRRQSAAASPLAHRSLQRSEPHTAVANKVEDSKTFGLNASSCTSSNDGMLSSHSRSVAVCPTR